MLQPRFPPFDSLPHQSGGPVQLAYDPEQPDAIGAVPLAPTGVRTISSNATLLPGDAKLFVDSSAGNVTITLPTATRKHPVAIHWKTKGAHSLTVAVAAGTGTIEGSSSFAFSSEKESHVFSSDGVAYWAVF